MSFYEVWEEYKIFYLLGGLTPKHFWTLYKFLGDAKFSLSYWKNTKKQDFMGRKSTFLIAEQHYHFIAVTTDIASTFLHWLIFTKSANMQFVQFLQLGQCFCSNISRLWSSWISLNNKHTGRLCQWFFDLLIISVQVLTVLNSNVKCPETTVSRAILYSSDKSHCTMEMFNCC